MSEQIIIGIPGVWKNPGEVAKAVAQQNSGLLLAGFSLMDSASQDVSFVEWHEYDPRLVDIFETLGQPWINDKDLERIAEHQSTVWVLSSDVSIDHARRMMNVGRSLLKAGGLAVKVETSGMAHSAQRWQSFATSVAAAPQQATSSLYSAYVNLMSSQDYSYSCGMHNFGLPDVSFPLQNDTFATADLLHQFNQYQIESLPEFNDGDEFSLIEEGPRFSLSFEACEAYEAEHPFYNPFGRWHLTPQ